MKRKYILLILLSLLFIDNKITLKAQEDLNSLITNNDNITLDDNYLIDSPITIDNKVTINLNNYSIESNTSMSSLFIVNGTLIINGNGSINLKHSQTVSRKTTSYTFKVSKTGKVIINGNVSISYLDTAKAKGSFDNDGLVKLYNGSYNDDVSSFLSFGYKLENKKVIKDDNNIINDYNDFNNFVYEIENGNDFANQIINVVNDITLDDNFKVVNNTFKGTINFNNHSISNIKSYVFNKIEDGIINDLISNDYIVNEYHLYSITNISINYNINNLTIYIDNSIVTGKGIINNLILKTNIYNIDDNITINNITNNISSIFYGASLQIGTSLDINFYFDLSNYQINDQYVIFNLLDYSQKINGNLVNINNKDLYKYTFTELSIDLLTCPIKTSIYINDNLIDIISYNVISYINNTLNNTTDIKLINLLSSLVEYGTSAQLYSNTNINNLLIDNISSNKLKTLEYDNNIDSIKDYSLPDDLNIITGIRFSKVNYLYFKYDNDKYTFKIIDNNGNDFSNIINDSKVYSQGIYSYNFDKMYTLYIYDNQELIGYYKYSINSFIKDNENNDVLSRLLKSLYNYGKASYEYGRS